MKIGFWELVVIVVIAFVFIGPDQLPVYAKKLGKMLRELKKYTGAASEEIQKNVVEPLNEIQAPLKEAVAPLTDIKKDIDIIWYTEQGGRRPHAAAACLVLYGDENARLNVPENFSLEERAEAAEDMLADVLESAA